MNKNFLIMTLASLALLGCANDYSVTSPDSGDATSTVSSSETTGVSSSEDIVVQPSSSSSEETVPQSSSETLAFSSAAVFSSSAVQSSSSSTVSSSSAPFDFDSTRNAFAQNCGESYGYLGQDADTSSIRSMSVMKAFDNPWKTAFLTQGGWMGITWNESVWGSTYTLKAGMFVPAGRLTANGYKNMAADLVKYPSMLDCTVVASKVEADSAIAIAKAMKDQEYSYENAWFWGE